jgi:hypothetical protein
MPIVKRLTAAAGPADVPTAAPGSPPYPGSLVVAPGDYTFAGYGGAWQLREPGLYALMNPLPAPPLIAAGNYVVAGGSDTLALLSAAAHLTVYGTHDVGLSLADQLAAARWRPLALQCGLTVAFAQALLSQPGAGTHRTRVVRLLTADVPNGWNDGHVALEANVGGRWAFVDVLLDRTWTLGGAPASLDDWLGGATEQPIAESGWSHLPYQAGHGSGFHAGIYWQTESVEAFTDRVFQIPGIEDADGLTYFYLPTGTEARQAWLLSLSPSYRVLSLTDWLGRFYT